MDREIAGRIVEVAEEERFIPSPSCASPRECTQGHSCINLIGIGTELQNFLDGKKNHLQTIVSRNECRREQVIFALGRVRKLAPEIIIPDRFLPPVPGV